MTKPEVDSSDIEKIFEQPVGTSTDDWFEVHTLSGDEPDIECIHLTDRAKREITSQLEAMMVKAEFQGKVTGLLRGFACDNDGEFDAVFKEFKDSLKSKLQGEDHE